MPHSPAWNTFDRHCHSYAVGVTLQCFFNSSLPQVRRVGKEHKSPKKKKRPENKENRHSCRSNAEALGSLLFHSCSKWGLRNLTIWEEWKNELFFVWEKSERIWSHAGVRWEDTLQVHEQLIHLSSVRALSWSWLLWIRGKEQACPSHSTVHCQSAYCHVFKKREEMQEPRGNPCWVSMQNFPHRVTQTPAQTEEPGVLRHHHSALCL